MYILSLIYNLITKIRNILYDKNIIKVNKVENVNIICIGNITVGGTGKTPCVQHYANKYLLMGKKVAIISRGYKGKREKDPLVVSDGNEIFATASESGDESFTHALNLKIPVVVGVDRFSAIKLAKEKFNINTIILDDGFQHRKLHRDKNIVLIDALNPFGNSKLLPKGRLREGLYALKRADEFIITKSDNVSKDELDHIVSKLKVYDKKISFAVHKPTELTKFVSEENYNFNILDRKNILIFTSIENPTSLKKSISDFGANKVLVYEKRDHAEFYKADYDNMAKIVIENKIDIVIITEKDKVKILKEIPYSEKFYVFKIKFEITE